MIHRPTSRRAFTLIEVMIVISIVAIVMSAGVPMMFRAMNKNPFAKAVNDVLEGCKTARDRAILRNQPYDMVIRLQNESENDYEIQIEAAKIRDAGPLLTKAAAAAAAAPATDAGAVVADFPRAIGQDVQIELLYVNFIDMMAGNEARVRFYPNGTSDEFTLILGHKGEKRTLTVDIITGAAYEVIKP